MVETHVLDFSGELYGKELEVGFHTFLREERKFDSVAEKKRKIQRDVSRAREVLAG
jgi:riboflavin kinase/FMN adenylyltransferase